MKIGLIISSLTHGITYASCLVSLGYDVIPIVVNNETITSRCSGLSKVIETIVNKKILYIDNLELSEKLDAIIVINDYFLLNIDYSSIVKENAPIILNINSSSNNENNLLDYNNLYITAYNSQNIVQNCNCIISKLEKVLKK